MIKTEQNKRNPLRILEQSTQGEVGKGNIGVIAARKGVGKTACLVHIATEELFEGKHVIHVSFSADTKHIIAWYEDIFEEIAKKFNIESSKDIHDEIIKNRIIMNFNQDGTKILQIANSIKSMIKDGHFTANTIVIDGYDFNKCTMNDIKTIRSLADELGLEIWFSASIKDDNSELDKNGVPLLLKEFINEITILIYMKPENDYIRLQLIKDHEILPVSNLHLKLDPKSLLVVETE
jgi:thymidine kinase